MKSSATRNKSYKKKEAAKAESSEDEDSDSCSDNESSESVGNGRRRQRKIQQFSVLRSDSDGLRMKISAIRNKKEKPATNTSKNNNNHAEVGKREAAQKSNKSIKRKLSTASSSSCCCSESESSSVQTKEKLKKVRLKRKKNYTSSASDAKFAGLSTDSECGTGAAEKKDKELTRIPAKPDANLTSSTPKYGGENLPGSSISSSDTELPALVNAAIKCVESGSETENAPVSAAPSVNQYTSTLLHDFMVKTQMLGGNCPDGEKSDVKTAPSGNVMGVPKSESGNAADISDRTFKKEIQTKKKRGRPKKKTVLEAVATAIVNESGDSGITSTVQSSSSPSPNNPNIKKNKNIIQEAIQNGFLDQKDVHVPKINVASLEKQMYATERVLYPPRSKKKMAPKANNRGKSSKDDVIDPLWRKIDVNTKFRRPSLTGYKSDGGNTVCSKILAAKSGYVSDYGSVGNRVLSGYKSDVSAKSRYSMRSCISRAKSCDFRCGSSSGRSRKMRRKRRMLEKPMKKFGNVNEQDILQLAGLSLGQSSEESSRESLSKPIISYGQSKKYGEINRFVRTGEYFGRNKKNMVSTALAEACQSAAENLNTRTNLFTNKLVCNATKYLEFSNELESLRSKIRSRRSSAISRCSSLSMCSRYDVRKRKRRKFRIKSQSRSGFIDSKLNTEIEILISTFPSLCRINSDRTGYGKDRSDKDKSGLLGQKMLSKRHQKKRKLSESAEHHMAKKFPNDLCLLLKRRHKKTGNNCQDEHKLPLKKRHYLITPGERSDGRSAHHSMESRAKDVIELKTAGKHLANSHAKLPPKAVTPKKRHLLESSNSPRPDESFMQSAKGNYSPLTTELKPSINLLENAGEATRPSQKIEEKAKKKNRLEGVVSKIQSVGGHSSKETNRNSADIPAPAYPPPGVFEPSVELEIQITLPKQALAIVTKSEIDSPKNLLDPAELEKLLPEPKTERMVETLLNRTGGSLLLKRKRRKTFNRTGFPAMKKKKRKVISGVSTSASETDSKPIGPVPKFCKTPIVTATSSETVSCDRVPHIGETSTTFLQRTKQPRLSVVSLERLQEPNKKSETVEMIAKETTELGPGPVTNEIPKIGKRGRRSTMKPNISEVSPVEEAPVQKTVISTTSEKPCKSDVEMPTKSVGRKKASQASKGDFKENKEKNETKYAKEIKDKVESKENKEKAIQKEKKENKPTKYTKGTPQHTSTSKATEKCDTTANTRSRNKTVNIPKTITNLLPTTKILNVRLRRTKTYGGKVIESEMRRISQRSKSVTYSDIPTKSETKDEKIKTDTAAEKTSRISTSLKVKSTKKELPGECSLLDDLEQEPLPLHEGPDSAHENSDSTSSGSKLKKLTKLKKPYLPAGLLSDYYKCEKMRKPADKSDKSLLVVANEQHTSKNILPPPPYCEKFFRKSNYDFLLPYDLWWAHTNSKLPARNTVPSWNYRKIRSNIYGDTRHNPSSEYQTCNCKPQTACGDDCLNRMVYTECSPSNCPCGDKCRNQKIQKHDIAPGTERFMTANKGWGVKANMSIRKGMYIMEYVGEVVTEKEFKERMATLYVNDTHHYCLHLDGGLVIDGHRMGSDGRFVNHSCSPNCEMQKWSVNGLFRMALFALRNIEPGEELTYDYNFSLFNPSEGQPCRCETPQCRGVIGGKSQRVKPLENKVVEPPPSNRHGRPRKRTAKKNSGRIQSKDVVIPQFQIPTDRERKIIKFKHCFLLRNLEKVRKIKMKSNIVPKVEESPTRPITPSSFAVQISALRNKRSIKTRGLTQAAHDPEVEKMAKMAVILRAICAELESIKDSTGKSQLSKLIPATKKKRASLEKPKPMGFATIQANIEKGYYKDAESFDADVNKVFDTATTFFEPNSEESLAIENLKSAYVLNKSKFYDQLAELVSEKSLKNFRSEQNEMKLQTPVVKVTEDIIRCICGLFKDEGLMIQCAKCLVWQHAECTKADIKAENYNCEKCDNRTVNYEIPLEEFTDDGFRYYLSLLRGDLQVRQGDTVYVLRDIPIKEENGKTIATKKHTYETIGTIDYSECDIFRVERLWKNDQGKRLIFGHHYLRPHETFHEPSRRFYANEVIRVPLYEVVPIELVIARCWVLDRSTFCKGRPVDCAAEKHVYICELRVDKSARFFSKAKQAYPTCTKNYAFKKFQEKLKIFKTYAPHDVDPNFLKSKKRKAEDVVVTPKKILCPIIQLVPPPPKTLNEKRSRLEAVLVNLKLKKTSEPRIAPVDLSYLLTGRGARQRRAITAVVPI